MSLKAATTVFARLLGSFRMMMVFRVLSTRVSRNDFWFFPKMVSISKWPGVCLSSASAGLMFNANIVGNKTAFEVLGTVAVALSPVRKLLIQFSASLSLQLDIAIERILADRDTEFQLQASTDDFRRGVDGKLLPDEGLNVWFQLVKSIVWLRLMTPPSCQSDCPSIAVDTVESGVGIASEFPANNGAEQIKLSGDGSLVEAFTPPLFDVEPFFLSEMFSLYATGSPVELEQ